MESKIEKAILDYGMQSVYDGAIVGFSGGADSSALLHFILKKSARVRAVHINHMIRGEEAERDELFCKSVCREYGIEFISYKIDIPSLSKQRKKGLEETAREERYRIFASELGNHPEYKCIVTAHNANDNAETVIFNLARGSGTRGMCGISPAKNNIMRPLIYCAKKEIIAYCNDNNIRYVTDSTNSDIGYTRNYIRHKIVSELEMLNPEFVSSVTKLSSILREDEFYIDSVCKKIISEYKIEKSAPRELLESLENSLLYRVLQSMSGGCIDYKSYALCRSFIKNASVGEAINLGGGNSFKMERNCVHFISTEMLKRKEYNIRLLRGLNRIDIINTIIAVNTDEVPCGYSLYAEENFCEDGIKGDIFARNRRDGDKIINGKMTKKLKKIFCDKHIPSHIRDEIPVIYDAAGIVSVSGIINRDGTALKNGEIRIKIFKTFNEHSEERK